MRDRNRLGGEVGNALNGESSLTSPFLCHTCTRRREHTGNMRGEIDIAMVRWAKQLFCI